MIKLTENLNSISEPFMGSEIVSLYKSFYKQTSRLSLYETGEKAVLLKFNGRLLVSGKINYDEVKAFCRVLGIDKIEILKKDLDFVPPVSSFHSIMEFSKDSENLPSPSCAADMKVPFEILKASDKIFNDNTQYDYWLSDIRCLQNNGFCSVFLKDNKATASVTARGFNKCLISQVATLPEERRKNLASSLLKEICHFEKSKGLSPFLVSKNPSTDRFYEKLGFTNRETKVIIYL